MIFVAIDGDHIGETLETLLVKRDLPGATEYSESVAGLFNQIRHILEEAGATVYICAGDSLLASFPEDPFSIDLLKDHLPRGPCTYSIGIGWDSRTAYMALKVAKALGRNQIFSMINEFYTPRK
jgi:hypothetical protein